MDNNVALVLDTNFVYAEASQLGELLANLLEKFVVYITQISVDENEYRCRAADC